MPLSGCSLNLRIFPSHKMPPHGSELNHRLRPEGTVIPLKPLVVYEVVRVWHTRHTN